MLNEELDAKPLKPEQGRQMADMYAYAATSQQELLQFSGVEIVGKGCESANVIRSEITALPAAL